MCGDCGRSREVSLAWRIASRADDPWSCFLDAVLLAGPWEAPPGGTSVPVGMEKLMQALPFTDAYAVPKFSSRALQLEPGGNGRVRSLDLGPTRRGPAPGSTENCTAPSALVVVWMLV